MTRGWQAVLGAAALLGTVAGCAWEPIVIERPQEIPAAAPKGIAPLSFGETRAAVLDCSQNDCNHWYRIDPTSAGSVRVEVTPEPSPEKHLLRVVVRRMGHEIVADEVSLEGDPIALDAQVQRGIFGILVHGGGARRPYTIRASFEAGSSPYPPPTSFP